MEPFNKPPMPKGYKLYHIDSKEWYGPFTHFVDAINTAKVSMMTPDEVFFFRNCEHILNSQINPDDYSSIKIHWEKVGEFIIPLEYRDWDWPKFNSYLDPETPRLNKWFWLKFKIYDFCVKVREILHFF